MEREIQFRAGNTRVGSDFDDGDKLLFNILGICPDKLVDLYPEAPGLAVQRGSKRVKIAIEDDPVDDPFVSDLASFRSADIAAVGDCARAGSSESESLISLRRSVAVCAEKRSEFYELQCQLARMEISHREREDIRLAEERRELREEKERERRREDERIAQREIDRRELREEKERARKREEDRERKEDERIAQREREREARLERDRVDRLEREQAALKERERESKRERERDAKRLKEKELEARSKTAKECAPKKLKEVAVKVSRRGRLVVRREDKNADDS